MSQVRRPRTPHSRCTSTTTATSSPVPLSASYPAIKSSPTLASMSQLRKPKGFVLLPPPSQAVPTKRTPRSGKTSSKRRTPAELPSRSQPRTRTRSQAPATAHSPTLLRSLATTPWEILDPENHYLLTSSRLFQLAHLELGPITREQCGYREPKYGASRGIGANARKQHAKRILDQLEHDRNRNPPSTSRRVLRDPPSWAKDRRGVEWETLLLRRLSARLSHAPRSTTNRGTGEDLIPLVWAIDLRDNLHHAVLGNLDCWILGKEFPCRRVIVTGWILEAEYRETESRKWWTYTIDDGTALVQVVCPINSTTSASNSASATTIDPVLSPNARIPEHYHPPPRSREEELHSPTRFKKKRRYDLLEPTTSSSTVFRSETLVRVVGTITNPGFYETDLKLTADRIERIELKDEAMHHLATAQLWREVYAHEVNVREMLDRIELEEKDERRQASQARPLPGSESGSEFGDTSGMSSSAPGDISSRPIRYRPTRPSKLLPQDLTLTNFIIYIRHHLLKNYVESISPSSSTELLPPPSSQGSGPNPTPSQPEDDDEDHERIEHCLPFDISQLRTNKHLELFAKRLCLERLRKDRDKKRLDRIEHERDGNLARAVPAYEPGSPTGRKQTTGMVWVNDQERTRGAIKEGRGKVRVGSSKLIKMLPPPSASAHSRKSQPGEQNEGGTLEYQELGLTEKKLDKEIKRCWEDAIRTMRKNGFIVEHMNTVKEEEPEEQSTIIEDEEIQFDVDDPVLPDEPRHRYSNKMTLGCKLRLTETSTPTTPTSKKFEIARTRGNGDDTPRASSLRSAPGPAPKNPTVRPIRDCEERFELVTPLSLAPTVLGLVEQLARVATADQSSITELDVRMAMYRAHRWTAVAKYGEVVTRSLEVLEKRGDLRAQGQGYRPT
ncbi:uncharacterized protein JCM15063_001709 [Sporobolomyces koalae]|uniref:uncharacterized protein n=1 Tax=Sporobolomyces koalae TaxID=500713 RepID=UPI00317DDE30